MNHLEFAAIESFESPSDRSWDAFVQKVELLLGSNLDGNQAEDGYSIDFAYDHWREGYSAAEYVTQVEISKSVKAS